MFAATASWRYTRHDLGAVFNALFGVKGTLVAGDSLANNLAVFVYEYAHLTLPVMRLRRPLFSRRP